MFIYFLEQVWNYNCDAFYNHAALIQLSYWDYYIAAGKRKKACYPFPHMAEGVDYIDY